MKPFDSSFSTQIIAITLRVSDSHRYLYVKPKKRRHVERESRALQRVEPPASCRISRPIYPPTKSQQAAGSQPTANGQLTARAQRDAIPQLVLPHFFNCDAEATMDQGTKRKADDGGSGSSDKRSKVSLFNVYCRRTRTNFHLHERMLWDSHTFFWRGWLTHHLPVFIKKKNDKQLTTSRVFLDRRKNNGASLAETRTPRKRLEQSCRATAAFSPRATKAGRRNA